MLGDLSFYAVALPAVVLYGLAKGGFAGVSLMAIPLMSLVMPPVQAAAILLPVLLVQDVITIYAYRREWDGKTLKMLLPGALIGIAFGAATAAVVSLDVIRLAVGIMAIAFCLNYWFGPDLNARPAAPHNAHEALPLGALSGYTSFVLHAGGPPYNMYTLVRLHEPSIFAGTSAIFFGLLNLLKVPPYVWLGQINVTNLSLSATLVPVAIAGNLLGIWLLRRISKALFYRIIYLLTATVGAKLVVDGMKAF